MKALNNYITERLRIDKDANHLCKYIDSMPLGKEKSQEIFDFLNDKYKDMFDEMRLMRTGNIKLGKITSDYLIPNGTYNTSEFVFYIYDDMYSIRRTKLDVSYVHPNVFASGKTLEETINRFDELLTKRKYKLPK